MRFAFNPVVRPRLKKEKAKEPNTEMEMGNSSVKFLLP